MTRIVIQCARDAPSRCNSAPYLAHKPVADDAQRRPAISVDWAIIAADQAIEPEHPAL